MAHLTCHECGKAYNYAIDESCPKCGSYNSPKGGSSTQLEGELLSRFGDARSNQQRGAQPQHRPPQYQSANPERSYRQPDRRTPPPQGRPTQANPWEPQQKSSNKKKPLTLGGIIKAIVIIFILVNLVFPALIVLLTGL